MQHLFVYGSLLFPELVEKLTGKVFDSVSAILDDYQRFAVKGCDYPAIIQANGAEVGGRLLLNVDDESIKILTFFEGGEYQKELIQVSTEEKKMEAIVFVWNSNKSFLENYDWDKESFRQSSLSYYLGKIAKETRDDYRNLSF